MAQFRDFDAEMAAGEPIRFRLAGRDWQTVPDVPAGAVFDLARVADAEGAEAFQAFVDFLTAVIDPSQADEFVAALPQVPLKSLLAVVQWVMAEAAAVPFTQP